MRTFPLPENGFHFRGEKYEDGFFPNSSFPKCLSNSLCKHISAYGLFINSSISFSTKVWNWLPKPRAGYLFIYLLIYDWVNETF